MRQIFIVGIAAILAGCTAAAEPILAKPGAGSTTSNAGLADADLVDEFLAQRYGEYVSMRYFSAQSDLNDDGRPETIVYVAGPMVCGTGGCTTMVFERVGNRMEVRMDASVTRLPITVLPEVTQGWHDLGVAIGGGGMAAATMRMQFDGNSYPDNPTVPPATPTDQTGSILIGEDIWN